MTAKTIILLATILGGSGVAIGAFAAHYLDKLLAGQEMSATDLQKRKEWMEVGTKYQMYHAAALLGVAALVRAGAIANATGPAIAFFFGAVIFSGCLHTMAVTGIKPLGAVVPIGGLMFIVGWIWLAIAAMKTQ